jgi:Protein of unknown function (DUF2845)
VSLRVFCSVTLLASLLASANAQAMRCGVSLVAQGQWMYEVLEQCGAPIEQHTRTIFLGVNEGYAINGFAAATSIVVDEWVYDFGPHRLRRLLRFEDGQLMRIETLDRGVLLPVR